jgi:hypothetical protein
MIHDPSIPEGHITLKDASKISGYAPDYVGQLIRKGKLYGKQIYINTAWVTTEQAIKEYMEQGRIPDERGEDEIKERIQTIKNTLLSEGRLSKALQVLLYIGLAISFVLCLSLFYILSVNIDRALDRKAIEAVMDKD